MINIYKNHIFILIATTLLTLIFSGSIDYTESKYSNSDLNKYITMAEASPGLDTDVIRPFVYRIGAPWVAGLLPFSIPINFYLLNLFALIALILSFYFFLIEFGVEKKLALIISIIFQLNKYFYIFLAWNQFQLNDTLSLAVLFYSFVLIKRRNIIFLFFLMVPSILVKEYVLFIIPAGIVYLHLNESNNKNIFRFSLISLVSILLFMFIRKLIVSDGGESLFIQYTTQVIYYTTPKLLLKRFIIPFTPFGLLPIIFYKDLAQFFKFNKHFFIYSLTVIVLSFFGEPERLIEPLAPVYYLFVAVLIRKYILLNENEIFSNKILILLVVSSFLSSFYHLWGIILLPNELLSIISTIFFNLLVGTILYFSQRLSKNKIEVRMDS